MTLRARIFPADLDDPADRDAWLNLLNAYAQSAAGLGRALDGEILSVLPQRVSCWPGFYSWLAWDGRRAVGIVNCFTGFSTFAGRATLNIHDLYIDPQYRGHGIGRQLLERAEDEARHLQCCKVTLEVLEHNTSALRLYEKCGFAPYTLLPAAGRALFFEKLLSLKLDQP